MKKHEINHRYTFWRKKPRGSRQSKLLSIACRFDEEIFDWLVERAAKQGVSVAEAIRRCVGTVIEQSKTDDQK